MAADGLGLAAALPLLTQVQRNQLTHDWNRTSTEFPSDNCIHELFEEQVARTPGATALEFKNAFLSYAELNSRANQLAHYLRNIGVQPDTRVAICAERGFEAIIALLAVLKAGGAYVPLDAGYPVERLRFMLEDSAPLALLTQAHLRPLFSAMGEDLRVLDLRPANPAWRELAVTNPGTESVQVTPNHLAYVIYTSGSTGQSKGVAVTHANVVSSTFARRPVYGTLGRVLLASPLSFDNSIAAIFGSLTNFGTLVLGEENATHDLFSLIRYVQQHKVDTLICVPSLYRQVLECTAGNSGSCVLARVIVGGEQCPAELVAESLKKQPQALLFNEYGPTECTVWASVYQCVGRLTERVVPIGRPSATTQVYVWEGAGEPAPGGVAGELYIGGAGVARGYWQ